MTADDRLMRDVLTGCRTVAVVGYSANPARPAHGVAVALQRWGYRVIPVNPGLAGQVHLGEVVHPDLAAIPDHVDMVDVFRTSDAVPGIVEQALARTPRPHALWLQIGVGHPAAEDAARAGGIRVVSDRCPKIEIPRLFGTAGPFAG